MLEYTRLLARRHCTALYRNVHRTARVPQFDGVLENTSQEVTYTAAAHETVEGVLQGISGTLFCYGQVRAVRYSL